MSALTGLSPNTIRTWERRYGAVQPRRSSAGGRRYDEQEVARLAMLRQLTDAGQAIGELAELSDAALRGRLRSIARGARSGALRIGTSSKALLPTLEQALTPRAAFEISLEQDLNNFQGAALVLELADLGSDPAGRVRQLRQTTKAQVFVLYDFTSRTLREALAGAGAWLLHGAPEPSTLRRLLRLLAPSPARAKRRKTTSRRFDDAALAKLMQIESPIQCECPQQLASIIRSLTAFEAYSRSCENQNPEDARLHRRLAEGTAEARARMEEMLVEVCEAEGLLDET